MFQIVRSFPSELLNLWESQFVLLVIFHREETLQDVLREFGCASVAVATTGAIECHLWLPGRGDVG